MAHITTLRFGDERLLETLEELVARADEGAVGGMYRDKTQVGVVYVRPAKITKTDEKQNWFWGKQHTPIEWQVEVISDGALPRTEGFEAVKEEESYQVKYRVEIGLALPAHSGPIDALALERQLRELLERAGANDLLWQELDDGFDDQEFDYPTVGAAGPFRGETSDWWFRCSTAGPPQQLLRFVDLLQPEIERAGLMARAESCRL